MVIIYSDKVINDLGGVYIAPFRFDTTDKRAKKVYTSDKKIADAYSGKCEVLSLPKARAVAKKAVIDAKD